MRKFRIGDEVVIDGKKGTIISLNEFENLYKVLLKTEQLIITEYEDNIKLLPGKQEIITK